MKNRLFFLGAGISIFIFALSTPLRAEPQPANAYDLLSRTIVPIASLFSPASTLHGLSATLILEEMTDLPPELVGARAELALQPPEHFLLRAPFLSGTATVCRSAQQIWFTPGSKLEALLNPTGKPIKPSKKKKDALLPGLSLPFPPQQLALLPMFFQITDGGSQNGLRILDVRLAPPLAKAQGIEDWSARLSINSEMKLARIEILRPGWHLVARVEHLEYATSLPEATWEPDSTDVVRLDAPQANAWFKALGVRINPPAKEETKP